MPQKPLGHTGILLFFWSDKKKKKKHPLDHVTLPALKANLIRALCGGSEICGDFCKCKGKSRWMDK